MKYSILLTLFLCVFAPLTAAEKHPWSDEIIYFVIVDRFADGNPDNNQDVDASHKGSFHGGDFRGLTAQLDEIADLGVTALWITPVVKQIDRYVEGAGFPDWGYHGYWADDFNKIEPRFGTEAELKTLVDEAHKRNIKVLLDVVYNHAGYFSRYTKADNANDWLRTGRRESPCGDDDITGCLSDLPDFKTEKPEVADYLMKAHLGLAKRVGLDGFRLDTVKHVDHPFWQAHRKRSKAELGDDFFLLGEVWGGDYKGLDAWFSGDEMDAGFDFSFRGSAMGFVQGRGRTIAFSRYLLKRHRVRQGYLLSQYLSSHDEPGALFELKGNKRLFKLCAALQLTTVGVPTIFYGEEVARDIRDWPHNRTHMPWGDRNILPGAGKKRDEDMRAYYKKLIQTRRAHKAFSHGAYKEISTDGDVLVFARVWQDEEVWVAVNRASADTEMTLTTPTGWSGKKIVEALEGAALDTSGEQVVFTVPAGTAQIYVPKQ